MVKVARSTIYKHICYRQINLEHELRSMHNLPVTILDIFL